MARLFEVRFKIEYTWLKVTADIVNGQLQSSPVIITAAIIAARLRKLEDHFSKFTDAYENILIANTDETATGSYDAQYEEGYDAQYEEGTMWYCESEAARLEAASFSSKDARPTEPTEGGRVARLPPINLPLEVGGAHGSVRIKHTEGNGRTEESWSRSGRPQLMEGGPRRSGARELIGNMGRSKHRIKQEMSDGRSGGAGAVVAGAGAGGSGATVAPVEDRELAYYIHDRVELMHQVFSILRSRELRAMTPNCVKNLSTDDLQELCLEELLGISSKRLCAILDGADPPSDTSSSESERLETVSLDSISSVDELSERDEPKNRKRKCKRKEAKAKNAAGKPAAQSDKSANKSANKAANKSANKTAGTSVNNSGGEKGSEGGDTRAAERAGMTVLELLELQARARAIRAQLVLEHSRKAVAADTPAASKSPDVSEDSDGSVEIKEEPSEVVELVSSDEEDRKPARDSLPNPPSAETSPTAPQSTITKRNDLTIIVPNAQKHRKVKLNRTKSVTVTAAETNSEVASPIAKTSISKDTAGKSVEKTVETVDKTAEMIEDKNITDKGKAGKEAEKAKAIKKKKLKKKKKTNSEGRDGSDHDEITLQLSDSEKMDLLEDFDRKNYDNVSSSDSEESSSDSGQSSNESGRKDGVINAKENEKRGGVSNDKKSQKKGDVSEAKNDEPKASGSADNVEKPNEEIDDTDKIIIERSKDEADGTIVIEGDDKNEINLLDTEQAGSENNLVKNTDEIESNQTILVEHENVEQDKINEVDIDNFALIESENKDDQLEIIAKISSETVEGSKEESQIVISSINDIPLREEIVDVTEVVQTEQSNTDDNTEEITEKQNTDESTEEITKKKEEQRGHIENTDTSGKVENKEKSVESGNKKTSEPKTDTDKEMSDGELSDRASSEIEIFEKPSEVVCISDDDDVPKKKEKKKKKDKAKKKEKKAKKDKKDKKSDFCKGADQNFFEKNTTKGDPIVIDNSEPALSKRLSIDSLNSNSTIDKTVSSPDYSSVKVDSDSEDIYEICEISDDSSCYEVEGVSVLSKEPTSEEIEALSAKIDTEIEREDVITDEQIQQHDNQVQISANTETDNLEDVSWKDRWLGSTKVKKVMKTSNILNAMRKKNKELKKKLAESKCKEEKSKEVIIEEPIAPVQEEISIEEGSITHFNTLQGSTQFVDPVKEPKAHDELIAAIKEAVGQTCNGSKEETTEETSTEEKEKEEQRPRVEEKVTNQEGEGTKPDLEIEMKKDAKQLLKMYKRLLKYNIMNKETDPNKVKKKKTKKQRKNKEKTTAAVVTA